MLVSNAPSHGPVLKPDTWTVTWWLSCCFHREDVQPSKLRWVQIGINLSFGATSNLTPGIVLCVQPRHSETFAPFLRSPRSLLDSSQETWYPTVNNEIFWGNSVQKKTNRHFITRLFTFSVSPQYLQATIGGHSIVIHFF